MTQEAKRNIPLFDIPVNRVPIDDAIRLSRQCRQMYDLLMRRPSSNVELQEISGSLAASARRSDIRSELRRHGWDLEIIEKRPGGVNIYAIKDASGNFIGI
jgi:hypothetical protein